MKVLIAVASRHGSTYEIAEAIAAELEEAGLTAEVKEINQNPHVLSYDAAVIGSAVYMGRWLSEAQNFVEDHQEALLEVPVWLFSSGPLGENSTEKEGEPYNLDELVTMTQAKGHQVFIGKLDKGDLGFGEKLVIRMVKAPDGDFRDWQAVSDWAQEIALTLMPVTVI